MAATEAREAAVASTRMSTVDAVGVRASSATPFVVAELQPELLEAWQVICAAGSEDVAPPTAVSVMATLEPLHTLTYSVPPAGTRDTSTLWRPIMVRPEAGREEQPKGPLAGGEAQVREKEGRADQGLVQPRVYTPLEGG